MALNPKLVLVVGVFLLSSRGRAAIDRMVEEFYYGKFPEGFLWGTATASYQIEGGWNLDGKSDSIWDALCRVPGAIKDGSDGTVACDSYHRYPEDVQLLKNMGVDHYRLSLSWPRIIPDPRTGVVNQRGIDYYNRVIDALIAADIIPMVTLYHWDLPDILETSRGGWLNDSLVDLFTHFADVSFAAFGDRVKWWITFNEPWVQALLGYGGGEKAPAVNKPATGPYKAAHVMIKAHAAAWHLYDDKYRSKQKGKISITLNSDWQTPLDPSDPKDVEAADRQQEFFLGWFAHPIYVDGDYPIVMKHYVMMKSQAAGVPNRLPEFTEAEKNYIAGTFDFFGLNHYTTSRVQHNVHGVTDPQMYWTDSDTATSPDPEWITSGSTWLYVVPWGLRRLLVWIKGHYGDVPIIITENGVSDRTGTLQDDHRVYFYKHYTNEMLKAIRLDGVNVIGYTAWSLLDNFEWEQGYVERFGLHHVEFKDPNRTRTPKNSAIYMRYLFRQNKFINPDPPKPHLPKCVVADSSGSRTSTSVSVLVVALFAKLWTVSS